MIIRIGISTLMNYEVINVTNVENNVHRCTREHPRTSTDKEPLGITLRYNHMVLFSLEQTQMHISCFLNRVLLVPIIGDGSFLLFSRNLDLIWG